MIFDVTDKIQTENIQQEVSPVADKANFVNRKIEYTDYKTLAGNPENLRALSNYDIEDMTTQLIALSPGDSDDQKVAQILSPLFVLPDGKVIEGNRRLSAITARDEAGLPINPEVPILRIRKEEAENKELLIQLQIVFGSSNKQLSAVEKARGVYELYRIYMDEITKEALAENPDQTESAIVRGAKTEAIKRIESQEHLKIKGQAVSQFVIVFESAPGWLLQECQMGNIALYPTYDLIRCHGKLSENNESYTLEDFYNQCVTDVGGGSPSKESIEASRDKLKSQWLSAERLAQIKITSPDVAEFVESGQLPNVEIASAVLEAAEKSGIAPKRIIEQALESVAESLGTEASEDTAVSTATDIRRAAAKLKNQGTEKAIEDDSRADWDDQTYIDQILAYTQLFGGIKTGKAFKSLSKESDLESVSSELRMTLYKLLEKFSTAFYKAIEQEQKNAAKLAKLSAVSNEEQDEAA